MDAATLANLELLCGSEGTKEGSLLARIECGCATDAGRRLLRRWISAPMIDAGAIKRRQDAVWAAVDGGSDVVLGGGLRTAAASAWCLRISLSAAAAP